MSDFALIAARLGAALRRAGVPADPGRCERFARAVTVARPATLRELYLCALATLVSRQDQVPTLEQVFQAMFGGEGASGGGDGQTPPAAPGGSSQPGEPAADLLAEAARAAQEHASQTGAQEVPAGGAELDWQEARSVPAGEDGEEPPDGDDEAQAARPALASAAERLAGKDFAELTPAELLLLTGLMRKLTLSVPYRRSRRHRRTSHGGRTDLRSTLRQARRTGGHPVRLARRAPMMEPRQLVVLCDISGSMEPYARAMLQLLYCAAGGVQAEVFTFATRLTRVTGALAHARPVLALQQAGHAAPDWLGGTRIGESLKQFNDRYGRRGMARGAVVVIISDGWDTGDPEVLRQEMERLSRVAHRIVWVNPRTASAEYQPLAGGMAAAWPYCDTVVSAHTVHALEELTDALAHPGQRRPTHRDGIRSAFPVAAPGQPRPPGPASGPEAAAARQRSFTIWSDGLAGGKSS
ncbi:MAG: VWA domain-containing protein [Actinobacteria bacterium]|nr:VWA domain-containing protein [Actinomycetota bacterium]